MRYLVRSIKYFIYLMIVLSLIIAVLVFAGFVEADIETMFTHGYDSLWQIALMMAVFALIYPRFGFSKRCAHVYGEQAEQKALRQEYIAALARCRLICEQIVRMTVTKTQIRQ